MRGGTRYCSASMQRALVLFLLAVAGVTTAHARTLVLNVATNGNDQWTGNLSAPTPNGQDGPLATLGAALNAARAARARLAGQPGGVTILLRGGTYELERPVGLLPIDSGIDAARPLLIAAYPGERPVLSGGRRITGWQPVDKKPGQWQTTVPEVREGKWCFHQLFVNGRRKQRARTPNEGFLRIQCDSPQGKPAQLSFRPGDLKPEWAADGDVELVAFLAWADLRMQIRAVDESNHVATLAGEPRPSNREKDAKYYIENAPDALDQPGEWYLHRRTGVLTYWAEPGEIMTEAEVIAPRLELLLRFQGDPGTQKPVANVVLRGLTFSHTDWPLGTNGYADTQAAIATHGDILAEWAVDCCVEDCLFTRLGGYGLEFGRGCQRIRIVGNEMYDLGGGGIRLGEPTPRTNRFDQCDHHTVTDNHLHHLGQVYSPAVGILILQSGNNRIAHNHIHDLYYTAISVGWNWGYRETPCHDNLVEFNHLHDIGKRLLSDMGAIYTLGIQKGTVIRNNLIHDVRAFTYGGWGLYPDEGSSYLVLENNVVYRCGSAGFHQHYGRENVVRNNIFAFNRDHGLMRTREEDHLSFTFTHNIVYFDSGDLLGSNWTNDKFALDYNVYFDARPEARPETMRFAGASLEDWRKRGHDRNSVIADPLFINPQRLIFRLNANSPAYKLGFKRIDLSRVGVRRKGNRT